MKESKTAEEQVPRPFHPQDCPLAVRSLAPVCPLAVRNLVPVLVTENDFGQSLLSYVAIRDFGHFLIGGRNTS